MESDVREALRDVLTVGAGYLPLGAGFGMLLVATGFSWWWAPVFSVIIYAGSMEFLAVVMLAGGAGLTQLASASFFVNFRHIFYGLTFPLRAVRGLFSRFYTVHAVTDEAYAILAVKDPARVTGRQVLITAGGCHLMWITGSTLGALAGTALPIDPRILGFTLTALFVVLAVDALRGAASPSYAIIAAGAGIVGLLLDPARMLLVAMSLYALIVAGIYLVGRGARNA